MADMEPEAALEEAAELLGAIEAGAAARAEYLQPNQCPGCGAYRLDCLPAEVHEHGCAWEADGLDRTVNRMLGLQ